MPRSRAGDRRGGCGARPARAARAARRPGAAGARPTARPRASRWSMASGAVGSPRPKRSRSVSNGPGSALGRRLRSPPNTSGSAPDHSSAASAAASTSRAAFSGSPAEACRFATQRRSPAAVSRRAHCMRRCSGRHARVSRRCSITRPGWRTRIWFEPPSLEAIRSGLRSASALCSGGSQLREVSTRTPLERVRRQSSANQRGGASCSSATCQSKPSSTRANSPSSGRLTCACVWLRSVMRSRRERSVSRAGSGGKSRPW